MSELDATSGFSDELAESIAEHLDALCTRYPGRSPGTDANHGATAYVSDAMEALDLAVEHLPFVVPGWRFGDAAITVGASKVAAHPGPFSPPVDAEGTLVAVSSAEALSGLARSGEAAGAVLLVHGELADEQLTPRDYPWYSNPPHIVIVEDIERAAPCAVVTATGLNPATTGALSPFPLIEDPAFTLPSAYINQDDGAMLLASVGQTAHVTIDSERFETRGTQPIGRFAGRERRRILVTSHLDTKPETPGALDNASGVAVMLGVAQLLRGQRFAPEDRRGRHEGPQVEFVPFNGEDHATSPGEVAYFDAYPNTSDIALVINIDGAGLAGGPSAVSRYNMTWDLDMLVARAHADHADVVEGPPWISGDHAIFVMRGIPALAVTSADMERAFSTLTHTPADALDRVDPAVLADTARFIADVIRRF